MEAGIKLFGKTITLPQLPSITIKQEGAGGGGRNDAAASPEELSTTTTTTSSGGGTSSTNTNNYSYTDHHHHHHHHVVQNMKRPDKIVACPRCNSMDTKFCYFNNYNVNQPRHFCKSCQRYWTAGGALRNVPIGAGRRKAKPMPMPLLAQGPPTSAPSTVLVDYSAGAVFDAAAASSSSSSYHDQAVLDEYWAAAHRRHQQQARGGLCDDFPVKRRREERAV